MKKYDPNPKRGGGFTSCNICNKKVFLKEGYYKCPIDNLFYHKDCHENEKKLVKK